MHTCGQCEYYRNKPDDCPHQEWTALVEDCGKFKYTNPEKRIDYLQAENKRLEDFIKEELQSMRNLVAEAELENDPKMRQFTQTLKGKITRYRTILDQALAGDKQ